MDQLLENLLIALLVSVLFLTFLVYKVVASLKEMLVLFRKWHRKPFAEQKLQNGEFDDVIERCKQDLEETPTLVKARSYLARAYFGKKMWKEAQEQLEIVGHMVPSWRREYTEPYLAEIEKVIQQEGD